MGIIFNETKLKGAFVIEPETHSDNRGFLKRSFSQKEFAEHGLNPNVAECNISFSEKRYTLRGMHFQKSICVRSLQRSNSGSVRD
jgi:dTDP-4-dehydrorhamnose 3,5-epimerase